MFTGKLLISILIFCGLVFAAQAQRPQAKPAVPTSKGPVSNLHKKYIPVRPGAIIFDSSSIIPKSFRMLAIPDSNYSIDYVNATLTWKKMPGLDSVLVSYRSFPYRLNAVVKRLNYDSIENNFLIQPATYSKSGSQYSDNFFNFGNITYNGSFGRGLSFGNSQDAVVTSNLNLQLSGYLADSIEISAAITDNNIPIQPDGTTADLSDFDKIYLQFKKKNWALSLGDLDLRQNQQYFLNFYKRLQGASFETTQQISPHVANKTLVSGAISKGKFNRNIFQGQEGNQGPYRLTGANNELYFIVLAGTEKVFIDGQMLQRGEDQDYVINYNTAEVTFTPKRMITKDSRIQVEFEYSNQYYLNVNLYLYDEANINDKLKIRAGVFSNSDSRNSPINQTLDANQKKFLNALGDSINRAFYPFAPVDTLSPGKVLYQKIDTIYIDANGLYRHDSVYVFSVNQSVKLFNLSFVDVGVGKGNYVPDLNGVNGNVYKWVAPVNGQMQGQFEAAQFLVTPKTQQVLSVGADYSMTRHTVISSEFAGSRYDVNTLSTRDKDNDYGWAGKLQLKNIHPFKSSSRGLSLSSNLSYEYVDTWFQPIERLRSVEFYRDWGLPYQVAPAPANETLYGAAFQLSDQKKNFVKYEFSGFDRSAQYNGFRNVISHEQEFGGWRLQDKFSLTNGNTPTDKSFYFRPSIDLSKTLKKFNDYVLGVNYSVEHDEDRNKFNDSVSATSFAFQIFQAYIKSPERKPNHWGVSYMSRDNSYPYGKELVKGDHSDNINLFAELRANKHEQFRINATYRNLKIMDDKLTTQQADKSLLGRAEYIVNEWSGLLTGNLLYEVGSGQEQKRAYTYLQVPAGTGQYAWIDLNGDGLQQLNEFVLAQFPDQAQFIRIFTPTNEYIKANYNTFNYSFQINPRAAIKPGAKGMKKFVSRISLQSSLQSNQKMIADGFIQLNPFKQPLNDTALITRTMIFANTFSFNKTSAAWGFDLNNSRNSSKTLLTYGYQQQTLQEWTLRGRVGLSKSFLFNVILKKGTNSLSNDSKNFDNSNYDLNQYSVEPDISYTRKSNLRVTIGYKYANKENNPTYGGEQYASHSLNTDFKYNILQNTSLVGKFTYSDISYSGQANSTVSYVILDGLLPGKNYLWDVDLTKKLGSNLELSVQYEGRKPGEGSTIHTGRVSLRAIL